MPNGGSGCEFPGRWARGAAWVGPLQPTVSLQRLGGLSLRPQVSLIQHSIGAGPAEARAFESVAGSLYCPTITPIPARLRVGADLQAMREMYAGINWRSFGGTSPLHWYNGGENGNRARSSGANRTPARCTINRLPLTSSHVLMARPSRVRLGRARTKS
jgi:hypothetical protein